MSGAVALLLGVKPELTWRDVKHDNALDLGVTLGSPAVPRPA